MRLDLQSKEGNVSEPTEMGRRQTTSVLWYPSQMNRQPSFAAAH